MTNSLCVSPPSSIFGFPEWKEVDKFAYSAADVLSWVRCLQIGVRPGSWVKKQYLLTIKAENISSLKM